MREPYAFDPASYGAEVTADERTLTPDVLARLAALASERATERAFVGFIPQQARVPV